MFQVKVAFVVAQGNRTAVELASKFGVRSSQIEEWKKQTLTRAPESLADGRTRQPESSAKEKELYDQIGRLKMEVEW